jgi:diguanylate cyclase (GGDEF)-like protein
MMTSDAPARILLAEDDPSTSELLQTFLEGHGYTVASADTGRSALEALEHGGFDLILSDLAMPGGDGFELVSKIREMGLVDLPFILMSANYESALRVQGLNLGADDFVLKPLDLDELLARVQSHLRRSGRQTQLVRDTLIDPLTQVLNRRGIAEQFDSQRLSGPGREIAALVIDVDAFKSINDRHGHATGDAALCAVSRALEQTVRSSDFVGRLGGDEFVVLMLDTDAKSAEHLAQRVRHASPLHIVTTSNAPLEVRYSVGLATGTSEDLDSLLSSADAQMYERKRRAGSDN